VLPIILTRQLTLEPFEYSWRSLFEKVLSYHQHSTSFLATIKISLDGTTHIFHKIILVLYTKFSTTMLLSCKRI